MKCINCQTDHNLKERRANGGRCLRCNHQFAFEPTAMTDVKITDPMFAKAIADISVNDTLFFTPKQLFYLLDQRSRLQNDNLFGLVLQCMFFNFWGLFFGVMFFLSLEMTNELIYAMLALNSLLLVVFFVKSRSRKYLYK